MKKKDKNQSKDRQPDKDKQPEQQPAGELEKLHADLQQLRKEKEEIFARLQRVSADYANYQKRAVKQVADSVAFEKEALIRSLLPALDNFEHALEGAQNTGNNQAVLKGMTMVYDHLLEILKSHGVEPVDALGEKFDPALHQAMTSRSDPDKPADVVLEQYQKGYKLNGRLIRPCKVIVNKPAVKTQQPQSPTTDAEDDRQTDETTDRE